jgi:hypothetical protein
MSSPLWKISALAAVLVFVSFAPASAQICGDADASGAVSVTDGVATLRAAAALSSTCTSSRCDVDGSGSITVTDGVNVLRKAAGIAITENCPGSSRDEQVEQLLKNSLPVFGDLIKLGGGAGGARAAGSEQFCDNQDGGVEIDQETGEITFFNCELAGFVYDGSIGGDESTLFLDLFIIDLATSETQTFAGQFGGFFDNQENFVVTGFLDFGSSSFGQFSIEFADLVTDPDGFFIGGALAFTVDDATIPEVVGIQITFSPSDTARVDVLLDDSSSIPFTLNLVTFELVQVSN